MKLPSRARHAPGFCPPLALRTGLDWQRLRCVERIFGTPASNRHWLKKDIPMRLPTIALLVSICSAPAWAGCTAESNGTRAHLVELYTSEGCSSCPPADAWLRKLHSGDDAVALAFHVDYWDKLGWRDRFDDSRYTERQGAIADRDGGTSIYTPQVVLDGHGWAGWYRAGTLPNAVRSTAQMNLSVQPGAKLHVQVDTHATQDQPGAAQLDPTLKNYVALVEDGLASQVKAGENNGVTLHHDHVVRAFAGPLPLSQTDIDLAVPSDVDLTRASVVAFAQSPRDGSIAQVVTLPLGQCRAP
jgi:hypothetical protein